MESNFLLAVETGDLDSFKSLVAEGSSILSYLTPHGNTILHIALMCGHKELAQMVLMILKAMPQLKDEADDFGCTPMHYAVYSGDPQTVFHLVQNGSSAAYSLNNKGRSPLHEAAAMGLMEAVREMVSHCRDSTEVLDSTGKNALHIAVESGQRKIIKYLLSENDKLINQRDADGNTPLHIASLKTDSDALFALVLRDAVNLYAENRSGQTFIDMVATKPTADNFFKMQDFHFILTGALELNPTLANSLNNKYMETMRTSARLLYDWRMDKISIMATLIATVTFAAGLTAPGGFVNSGPDEGTPTLARAAAFKAFMVFDTLGLFFSLVLIAFASVKAEMIEKHIIQYTLLTGWFVDFSLTSVAMAFATGVYAFLSSQSLSLAIFVCILCCVMLMLVWLPSTAVSFWLSFRRSFVGGFKRARHDLALEHPETQPDVSPQTVITI